MEQYHQPKLFNEDELERQAAMQEQVGLDYHQEAIRRHYKAMNTFGDFDPMIESVEDEVFHDLAEDMSLSAEEAQLVFDSWVRIFYYGER